MYRYTTPTLPITIDDIDFSLVDNFRIAIEQDKHDDLLFIVGAYEKYYDVLRYAVKSDTERHGAVIYDDYLVEIAKEVYEH